MAASRTNLRRLRATRAGREGALLLVDSDPYVRSLVVAALEQRGFAVVSMGGGIELLGHVATRFDRRSARPRVLIAVLRSPDPTLDGLCRFCASEWQTPIVAVTAFTNPTPSRLALIGATEEVGEPFEMESLVTAMVRAEQRARQPATAGDNPPRSAAAHSR